MFFLSEVFEMTSVALVSVIHHYHINVLHTGSLALWFECSPMFQFNPRSAHTKYFKWYLVLPCLTLSNIRYVSRVKWSNPGKEVALCPTPRCCSYWKASLLVALGYCRHIYIIYIYIYNYIYVCVCVCVFPLVIWMIFIACQPFWRYFST